MTTVSLLQLKSDFYRFQGERYSGTATGGSALKLTDTSLIGYVSETWPTKLEGVQLRMTSGLASGDLRMVGRVDRSEGDLYPNRTLSGAVANTNTYDLWGTAINGGTPLTDLFNDVLSGVGPVTDTQLTIVTSQTQYALAMCRTRRDIRGVHRRLLDPNNLRPYIRQDLRAGIDYWAYDSGGGTTPAVTLELAIPFTLQPTVHQLWVTAETTFVPLVDDTSTVDAAYRDWLAWEAVLELCERKLSSSNSDRGRWTSLQKRAAGQVSTFRAAWLPQNPVEIATFP